MTTFLLPFPLILASTFPCVEINLRNKTCLLKDRNELSRRQETELRMRPTNKSLSTYKATCTGIMLWLIVNMEFATLQRIHHRPLYGYTAVIVLLHIIIKPCIILAIHMLYRIKSHKGMTTMFPNRDVVPDIALHTKLKNSHTLFR